MPVGQNRGGDRSLGSPESATARHHRQPQFPQGPPPGHPASAAGAAAEPAALAARIRRCRRRSRDSFATRCRSFWSSSSWWRWCSRGARRRVVRPQPRRQHRGQGRRMRGGGQGRRVLRRHAAVSDAAHDRPLHEHPHRDRGQSDPRGQGHEGQPDINDVRLEDTPTSSGSIGSLVAKITGRRRASSSPSRTRFRSSAPSSPA